MVLTTAQTAEIIKTYGKNQADTGATEVQIALFSARISYLTGHLKAHPHDRHTQHGLYKLVSSRRRLMTYLKRTNLEGYQRLIKQLEIRG